MRPCKPLPDTSPELLAATVSDIDTGSDYTIATDSLRISRSNVPDYTPLAFVLALDIALLGVNLHRIKAAGTGATSLLHDESLRLLRQARESQIKPEDIINRAAELLRLAKVSPQELIDPWVVLTSYEDQQQ